MGDKNATIRKLRAARRAAGLCPCGRALAGDKFKACRGCRVAQSIRQRAAYQAAKGLRHGLG